MLVLDRLKHKPNPQIPMAVKIGVKIISELKNFISLVAGNPAALDEFRCSDRAFLRARKLPFDRLVLLIAKLCKKTLSMELETFFGELRAGESCSVSAFTQQRMKLRASFFTLWNQVLWSSYYHYAGLQAKRWKGFRVVAADGSNISLVNTPALNGHFGGQRNQHTAFVQAKAFYYYDVLNELVLHPRIAPYRYGEVPMAYEGIERLEDDMLAIYDRNFCSYKMFALHLWAEREKKFLVRAREGIGYIRAFIQGNQNDAIVELAPTAEAIAGLRQSGFVADGKTSLRVRLVRVELEKTVEVLVTNLWEEEGHPAGQFKQLYFLRWGIETNISIQKNILGLESFSGLTVQAVEQDFYATVLMANLHSVLIKDAQQLVDEQAVGLRYPRKVNRNKSFGNLKLKLVALFTGSDTESILEILQAHFKRDTLPIRRNRSFPRTRKNKSTNSKYRTFTNFKPSH